MRFLVLIFVLGAGSGLAGENALLVSGGRLHADRHESDGVKVRLYTGAGYIEIDATYVVGFEADGEEAAAAAEVTRVSQNPAPLPSPEQLADSAADKYGLPRTLVRSVMAAESAYQPQAVSPKGALGLMQLMPSTARELGADPRDPAQNADAGALYLRQLLEKYRGGLYHALAAYNAGPAAVDKYKGIPPFPETIRYVNRIVRDWKQTQPAASPASSASTGSPSAGGGDPTVSFAESDRSSPPE